MRLSGYEDDDLFLRLFRAGYDNEYVPTSLSCWRIHAGSTSYTERMNQSRMIYLEKLLEEFGHDKHRNIHYRRDCIAPRFYRTLKHEYWRAYRNSNNKLMQRYISDMQRLVPCFGRKRRFALSLLLPLMRRRWIAAVIGRIPSAVHRTAVSWGLV